MTEYLEQYPWLLPLIVAAPVITMTWRYLRMIWNYLSSQIIRTAEFEGLLSTAVMCYLWENSRKSVPMHPRKFSSWFLYVRTKKAYHVVPFELLSGGGALFFFGWVPVWVTQASDKHDNKEQTTGSDDNSTLTIRYFRPALRVEAILKDACNFFNEVKDADNAERDQARKRDRFEVCRRVGSRGKSGGSENSIRAEPQVGRDTQPDKLHMRKRRPLGYKWDELGEEMRVEGESPFDFLAYPPNVLNEVKRVGKWLDHKEWYAERRIPWRLGIKLVGPPGSGKSSLCRSIGEEYNLPVYLFDLASMTNEDFIHMWEASVWRSPCMIVFEDIDAVFKGRTNKTNKDSMTQGLTFDCMLNCISGVGKNDGILLVITTNIEADIDTALTRNGRIDIELTLDGIDEACRRRVVNVVLSGIEEELRERVVREGHNDQPADFHNRCIRAAEKWVWEHEINVDVFPDMSPEASAERMFGSVRVETETSRI